MDLSTYQEYAKRKKLKAVDSHIEGSAAEAPAASAPTGKTMSQADFSYGKAESAEAKAAKQKKLIELLKAREGK